MLLIFSFICVHALFASSLVSTKWFGLVERSHRIRLIISPDRLVSFPQLQRSYKSLQIDTVPSSWSSIDSVLRLRAILKGCHDLFIGTIKSRKSLLDILTCCKQLRSLGIFEYGNLDSDKGNNDLSSLAKLACLREVILAGVDNINVIVFGTMKPMTKMHRLSLFNVEISDKSMQHLLKSMPHLETLELGGILGLTSAAFLSGDGLGALNRLNTLAIPASLITDDVVEKMQLPNLVFLELFKHKVICLQFAI
jgi:hypothetical protein